MHWASDVVIALVKLENLKAIHNYKMGCSEHWNVVIALVKLENLKAIHNNEWSAFVKKDVVIALVKLENLKAIHNKMSPELAEVRLLLH